ncbi:tyrosine-protein phosphatase [Streptomyces canus]|uniref:tyrosine-protein phosphatase n=1 Tax=Streptomyces canus TaxID=58343 RepID=UPI002E2AD7AF|nr:tyrosine-protein phosphatase [Streptomyces canus]
MARSPTTTSSTRWAAAPPIRACPERQRRAKRTERGGGRAGRGVDRRYGWHAARLRDVPRAAAFGFVAAPAVLLDRASRPGSGETAVTAAASTSRPPARSGPARPARRAAAWPRLLTRVCRPDENGDGVTTTFARSDLRFRRVSEPGGGRSRRPRAASADVLMPLVGVRQSYLGTALHEMRTRWGSIEGYFSEGLGLDGTTIDRLCTSYIEEASPTSDLTAIDILVEPDDTMKAKAGEINERMLKSIPPPAGFSLDEHHQPHITTEQCFVHTEAIHHLVEDKAKGVGIAFVVCKPGPELLDFQAELIDAVRPFTGSGGTAEAFVRTEAERDINPEGIAWAEDFVRDHSGADYFAHVTVGLAMLDDLKVMEAEPLEPLTFGAAGLAVHQLGNQGTAAKLLKSWRA